MQLSKRSQGVLIRLGIVVVGLFLYYWVYPFVSSFFPRSLDVHSPSLVVEGKFFPLTLDGMNRVYLLDGNMVVDGFDLHGFTVANQDPVSRKLPTEYSNVNIPDSLWRLVSGVGNIHGFTERLFVRSIGNDSITVRLPAMNDLPTWISYRGAKDTTLILLGSGNWKKGEKVYLGYIAAWHKQAN